MKRQHVFCRSENIYSSLQSFSTQYKRVCGLPNSRKTHFHDTLRTVPGGNDTLTHNIVLLYCIMAHGC